MRALRELHFTWRHLALVACISVGASVAMLLGGGGKSEAELAALAALHHPGTVTVASASSPTSGGSNNGSKPGGGGNGGGGVTPASTEPTGTSTSNTPTTTTTSKGDSKPKGGTSAPQPNAGLPTVKHVIEITLSTPSYKAAFDSKKNAPYLKELTKDGTVLTDFKSLGSGSELADYLAMVGGQKPNADTGVGCPKFKSFPGSAKVDKGGNVSGSGCIYPEAVSSIASQAEFEAQTWGAYIQDQGVNCAHVNPGTSQNVVINGTKPGYDSLHNPFIYFDGLLSDGSCSAEDQDLSALPKALKQSKQAPSLMYVAPNACADGDPQLEGTGTGTGTTTTTTPVTTTTTTPTTTPVTTTTTTTTPTTPAVNNQVCPTGQLSGIAAENAFLKTWVPKILASKAYKDDGVLVIAFAASGSKHSASGIPTGALVISKHTKRGGKVSKAFGPYSLLRSVSDMLNYPTNQPDKAPVMAQAATAKSFAKLVLR